MLMENHNHTEETTMDAPDEVTRAADEADARAEAARAAGAFATGARARYDAGDYEEALINALDALDTARVTNKTGAFTAIGVEPDLAETLAAQANRPARITDEGHIELFVRAAEHATAPGIPHKAMPATPAEESSESEDEE